MVIRGCGSLKLSNAICRTDRFCQLRVPGRRRFGGLRGKFEIPAQRFQEWRKCSAAHLLEAWLTSTAGRNPALRPLTLFCAIPPAKQSLPANLRKHLEGFQATCTSKRISDRNKRALPVAVAGNAEVRAKRFSAGLFQARFHSTTGPEIPQVSTNYSRREQAGLRSSGRSSGPGADTTRHISEYMSRWMPNLKSHEDHPRRKVNQ